VELEFRRAVEAAAPPAAPASGAGLVARWPLSEGKGTTTVEASGVLKATLMGSAAWTAGVSGSAIRLAGKGGFVALPNSPALDGIQGKSYTISIWYKPEAIPKDPNEKSWGGAEALVMKPPFREGIVYVAGGHFILVHWLSGPKWTSTGAWSET